MVDCMKTYEQFLSADYLGRVLLMKHAQESSNGKTVIYGDKQIAEGFRELASRLGYRVEKITPPAPHTIDDTIAEVAALAAADYARDQRRERVMEDAR